MPGGKFALQKSQNNQALAAAAAASGMGYPAPDAAPQSANDILALLQGGKMDPKMLMALLAMLAGMGPQGPAGAGQSQVPPEMQGAEGGGQSPIAAAYGA